MAKQTLAQKNTVERVMHEFKDGELESGPDGAAGKVRDPKQAIAIALSEAGVPDQRSSKAKTTSRRRTAKQKEARAPRPAKPSR